MNPTTVAVVEIHSDAINTLIAAASDDAGAIRVRPLERIGEVLELSGEIARDGSISDGSLSKLETVVKRYLKLAKRSSATTLVVATGAAARASNSVEIFERLSTSIGEPIRIMSQEREAALVMAAVMARPSVAGQRLIIDAGSAFTTVSIIEGPDVLTSSLLPLGTCGLSAELVGDPPKALSWSLLSARVGLANAALPEGEPAAALSTGAATHNLVGLDRTDDHAVDRPLRMSDLAGLADELLSTPVKKLARRRGEDPRRVGLLPPGLVVMASILDYYGLEETTVVPESIRDGIIAAAVLDPDGWWKG